MTNRRLAAQLGPISSRMRFALVSLTVFFGPVTTSCTANETDTPSISDLPVFEIEQDLRIDGHEANLVPIFWLGVGTDGTIVALQRQIQGIRFFDSLGMDKGLVGREGEGPGEFRGPIVAGWMGDTLWVSDFSLGRVALISTEPAFIRTLPRFTGADPRPEDEARFPRVSMLLPYALYPRDRLLIPSSGGELFEGSAFFIVSPEGIVERLVLRLPRDPDRRITVSSQSFSVPFFPRSQYEVAPDGSRIGTVTTDISGQEAGTFRVSIYDPFGSEIFSRAYPFQGVPIPEQAVDSAVQPQPLGSLPPGMTITRPKRPLGVERELKSRVPPFYPPVKEFLFGTDRRIWMKLFRPDSLEEWLILDGAGDPQGRIVLPARTELQVANETHIWALESDELDVESIVRFRLLGRD